MTTMWELVSEILLATGKQAAKKGGPEAFDLVESLAKLGAIAVEVWSDVVLTHAERAKLYAAEYRGLEECLAIAKEAGVEIAEEIPGMMLKASPSAVARLLF